MEIHMFEKNKAAIPVLLTVLLLVCACSLFNSESATLEPSPETEAPAVIDVPATESPATESPSTESPIIADESSPACMVQLESMLSADEDSGVSIDGPEADQEYILVTYQVSGDEISSPKVETNVPAEFVEYQNDTQTHEYLWKFFTDLIPAEQRGMISEFVIFSDGVDNVIGAVDEASTPGTWTLEMDIVDSQDLSTLSTTLIHEFGHMLTLSDQQIEESSSCSTYLTIDGCSRSGSYINDFYDAFWTDIYDEWASTVEFKDGEVNEDAVVDFYDTYPDQFVSDYAPTGPEEDIAESWIYFVFGPKPAGDTIAEEKAMFFYNYPELVALRQQILNGMCPYTQQ
jgi:hypothetical protein